MKYKVTLNGVAYEVEVEKGEALITEEYAVSPQVPAQAAAAPMPAVSPAALASGETVNAPMPGAIISVHVAPGQPVKKGTKLITLEAMKMENEIVAPRDAVVAQVFVSKGSTVETGAPLISLQ